MLSFQRLDVYQRAIEFLALVCDVVTDLPRGHADRADQLTRAAESVVRNIAEGAGRWSDADSANRYKIARGQAMECAASLDVRRGEDVLDLERGKATPGEVLARDNPVTELRDDVRFWRPVQDRMLDPYKQSCREGRYGEAAGRAFFDVGSTFAAQPGKLAGEDNWMADSFAAIAPDAAVENDVRQAKRAD